MQGCGRGDCGLLEKARLEDITEGQVFLVGQIQEALLYTLPLGTAARERHVNPAVLFVRLKIGVNVEPRFFVPGWVLGPQLSGALVASAVFPIDVVVEGNDDYDLAAPCGHQDRPGDGAPRPVFFLPWLRRDHLTHGKPEKPDCIHGELLGVTRNSGRYPRERHYDPGLGRKFWRSASELPAIRNQRIPHTNEVDGTKKSDFVSNWQC